MDNYEQPQASYPVLPPPSTEEKRACTHSFKDITAFGSLYITHLCIRCGEIRKELR
jgi:hypothetical protein